MRIDIDAVPPRGRPIEADESAAWVVRASECALGAVPVRASVAVTVYRVAGGARVRGRGDATIACACDRCGGDIVLLLEGDVDLRYVPHGQTGPEGVELASDELDVGWFDGHSLDLGDVWSEQLALWLPDVVRCDTPGATSADADRPCRLPIQDPGPDLKRRNPFAEIVLPE
ncbi:MAG: DUF177 domain-containing protein [Myxococcota bacterium]|nr:DUF177 domain-containing protein [Myxococcota bacterium]